MRKYVRSLLATVIFITGLVALSGCGGSTKHRYAEGEGGDHRARLEAGTDPDRGHESNGRSPVIEAYENRAYPRKYVSAAEVTSARADHAALPTRLPASSFRPGARDVRARAAVGADWDFAGPDNPFAAGPTTESLRDSVTSGRVTALAISPTCDTAGTGDGACRVWDATAGGGIWRTDDALAATPHWTVLESGLPTNTFGSLIVDPNDATGNTLYAGTGEANAVNQAGLGLYKSTNGGDSWSLVPGSYAIAHDRSIGALRIGTDAAHTIWMGTTAGTQGQSSANGGAVVPPGTAEMAVYKSTNGGQTFRLQKSMTPQGGTPPSNRTGSNIGGVNDIEIDPADPTTVYAAFFGYGIWRTTDSGATWTQVFTPDNATPPSRFQRTELALTRKAGKTRMYVADGGLNPATFDPTGDFYRADDASTVAAGPTHPGYTKLSSANNGDPGFASYQLCEGQCNYDLFVDVSPADPDVVWFGGSMRYEEIRPLQDQSLAGTSNRSNGRAVMRSQDAGVHFTDMTADNRDANPGEHYEQMHPDQHAIVFDPRKPDVAIVGSDGGVVRTDGNFDDTSSRCASREGVSDDPNDLADCQQWLSKIPHRIENMNVGLATLQFNSVSVDPRDPNGDLMGGTQDNGTFVLSRYLGAPDRTWFESVNGDGGPSAFDIGDENVRFHTYFLGAGDINHHSTDPHYWALITGPILDSGEATSFYTPVLGDPKVAGTMFVGAQHVWRSKDDGGDQAFLEQHCLSPGGVPQYDVPIDQCGDFQAMGPSLTSAALGTRSGQYVVAVERAPSDARTLWTATRVGRIFVSGNADAGDPAAVAFDRIDKPTTPDRFISGIAVDPNDANHAYVTYSGYYASNRSGTDTPGHVFDVHYDPTGHSATFTDVSSNLPDEPITDVAIDDLNGDLYAATDYGVVRRPAGATDWEKAASGFPLASTPGLTIVPKGRALYAATYGRSIWKLALAPVAKIVGPDTVARGDTVSFDSAGSATAGAASYKWTLPDGSTATTPTAAYKGSGAAGPQTVSLEVTDNKGRTATATKQIKLTEPASSGGGPAAGTPGKGKPRIGRLRGKRSKRRSVAVTVGVARTTRLKLTVRDQKGRLIGTRTVKVKRDDLLKLHVTVKPRRPVTSKSKWRVGATATGSTGRATKAVRFRARR